MFLGEDIDFNTLFATNLSLLLRKTRNVAIIATLHGQ